jgi:hypothetical protein
MKVMYFYVWFAIFMLDSKSNKNFSRLFVYTVHVLGVNHFRRKMVFSPSKAAFSPFPPAQAHPQ